MKHALSAMALLVLLALPGCKKDEAPRPSDLGHAYFPTEIGRWIEYAVDTAWRDDVTGVTDSLSYLLREALVEEFTDAEGRAAQRMIRYWDLAGTGQWLPKDVWWQVRSTTQAERSEENQRRIKLIFPPRTGQYWNTNAINTGTEYELTYVEVDVPWSINGMSFDSTLLVRTTYPNNPVVSRTYYERYAKHVGLVYRQADSTDTQYDMNGNQTVRGTWYKQVITGYGP